MLKLSQLFALRREIVLNSLFMRNYENTLNIKPENVYIFFMSWLDYEADTYKEDNPKASAKERDNYFNSLLVANRRNILKAYDYYISLTFEALPIEKSNEDEA